MTFNFNLNNPAKDERITIRISKHVKKDMNSIAKHNKTTLSNVISEFIRSGHTQYLAQISIEPKTK